MSSLLPPEGAGPQDVLARLDRAALTVFAGPSLVGSPIGRSAAHLTLPPVQDGDLAALAAEERPPATVLMIDGYFGAGQAVTLTEVRAAIDAGIRLYGCSSMGALRAVEARPWGMTGLGEIFTSYLTGARTRDENVVLLHDDEYQPLTVPTVNLDALCDLLLAENVPAGQVEGYRRAASGLYFGDRSFSALRALSRRHLADGAQTALRLLAPDQRWTWDVKRRDAEAALIAVALGRAPEAVPRPVRPVPEHLAAMLGDR